MRSMKYSSLQMFPVFAESMDSIFCNALHLTALTPGPMLKAATEMMLEATDILRHIAPGTGSRMAWQELHNKLQAFYLFRYADSILGLNNGTNLSLDQMVARSRSLGPCLSVWAMEGIGHYRARAFFATSTPPRALLCGHGDNLPDESLVPLHAGMGLALAEALLAYGHGASALAETFVHLCRNNSRPDYWLAAVEALGLVARNLYPGSLTPLDHHFSQTDQELLACFWHGVGRGSYFSLDNSLPYWSQPWEAFDFCIKRPAHELGRSNAVAGFIWALTLVNLRHPEIIAAFLEQKGGQAANHRALVNGIFSALCAWHISAPHDISVQLLCEYRPTPGPLADQLWEFYVRRPAREALQYGARRNAGELFRYCS